jgi:hypothetical protein
VFSVLACAALAHQRHMRVGKFRHNNGLGDAKVTLIT